MGNLINEIHVLYKYFNGENYLFFAIFILALIVIFTKETNKRIKDFFVGYSVVILLIIWNPICIYFLNKFINIGSMYRVYFALPNIVTIAYAMTKFTENGKKFKKFALVAMMSFFIIFFGNSIYNSQTLTEVNNKFKLPDEEVQIARIIKEDETTDYKKAMVPYGMSSHIRQIEPEIKMAYTRYVTNPKDENGSGLPTDSDDPAEYEPVQIYNSGNVIEIVKYCNKNNINYVVLSKQRNLKYNMEDCGFKLYKETLSYEIYKLETKFTDEELDQKAEYQFDTNIVRNINTINIKNEGIKSSYEFVFLTDLHLSVINDEETNAQIKETLENRNERFTTDNPNNEDFFKEVIKYVKNPNVNALLLGGDIIDTPADSNLNFLTTNLKELKKKCLYVFGNHDWTFSWDYQTKSTEEKYVPKFKELIGDTDVSYLEYPDLVILAINDSKGKIEEKSIEKIKQVLEKKKPTIVMMHVPIATEYIIEQNKKFRDRISAIGDGGIKPDESTKKAMELILSDKYGVFYILSGHIHVGMEDDINDRIHEIVSTPAYAGNMNIIRINKDLEKK